MKKTLKCIVLTILAVALMLNTCGIALAVDAPTVTITEEVANASKGVNKLVFTFTLPEDSELLVNSASMAFSFDNTVIQPVNKSGTYAAVELTESATTANKKKPLKAYQNPDGDTDGNFSSQITVKVIGDRTGVKWDTFTTDPESYAAYAGEGMMIAEFYYTVKEGQTPDSETFKLETTGEMFEALFPDLNTSYAISIGCNGGTVYKYGTPSTTDVEDIAKPELTYEGSDNVGGPTTYDVTVNEAANGIIVADSELTGLESGAVVNFEITPVIGYALSSLKVNEAEVSSAVVNGKYALTVTANTTVAATFTAIEISDEEEVSGKAFTAGKVYEVPADAEAENEKDRGESKLAFGKVIDVAGKSLHAAGMYVEVKEGDNWVDFKTSGTGFGPKFGAMKEKIINNQFGIRFFNVDAGTYRVKSYVEYKDTLTGEIAAPVYGEAIEFTVE